MKQYSKSYSSHEEFETRFKNFKASLTRVEQKNTKSLGGAVYGITKFSGKIFRIVEEKLCRNSIEDDHWIVVDLVNVEDG
jgi:hypothetical protein